MKNGIELIAKERQEQIKKHGRTIKQDVEFNNVGQLAFAASCLAFEDVEDWDPSVQRPEGWDPKIWEKMYMKPHRERLIIAGALIAAELDRLEYLSNKIDNNEKGNLNYSDHGSTGCL